MAAGQPYDNTIVLGRQYSFNATVYANTSQIAAIWLETPLDEPIGTQIDGDSISGRSSAYLNVQIPSPNSTTSGFHAACSIDARWRQSQILGSGVAELASDVTYEQSLAFSVSNWNVFPAVDDGKWRTVRLGIDWLNTLTPELANFSYWNTLSSIFTEIGLDNNTDLISNWGDVGTMMAAVISTVVADGMSRSGYEKNGGLGNTTYAPWPLSYMPGQESWSPIIAGSYMLPPDDIADESATDRVKMYWSVAVTGLGYRANSLAYYLALAVLFVHVVLAFGHIIWVCRTCKRETSTAWSSLTELITLALRSVPPDSTLDNAAAGVKRFKMFEDPVFIRRTSKQALNGGAPHQAVATQSSGEVEMILGTDYAPDIHKTVVIGKTY